MSIVSRTLQFAGGVVAGIVLIPAIGAAVLAVLLLAETLFPAERGGAAAPFALTTAGADVSRAGGSVLEVRRSTDELRLDCREACDDVRVDGGSGRMESIRVLNARGGCVSCRDLTQPYQGASGAQQWSVSGAPRLFIVGAAHD